MMYYISPEEVTRLAACGILAFCDVAICVLPAASGASHYERSEGPVPEARD